MATLIVPITADDHLEGPPEAPVTLVEYGDYECEHCGAAHPVIKLVLRHFGRRLRFVFRHFPLSQIHPHAEAAAETAAETAEFAAANGKFWVMNDAIFENQDLLGLPLLLSLAATVGLSQAELQDALEKPRGERLLCRGHCVIRDCEDVSATTPRLLSIEQKRQKIDDRHGHLAPAAP
jgi:protein-disulfide isomerase